jgi:nitrogenase molybdenum-iron protein NifN
LEFGRLLGMAESAGHILKRRFGVPRISLGLPMGIRETDALFAALEDVSGRPTPARYARERGRYVDALVDGHKYVSGKRAVVYGEEDLVIGLTAFLAEIGVHPVLVATGGRDKGFTAAVARACGDLVPAPLSVREGVDFFDIANEAANLEPDPPGRPQQWATATPAVERAPGARGLPHPRPFRRPARAPPVLRRGQALFDRVVNAVLARKQDACPVGYGYL